jgi:single-strand DNA-binding protein
MNKVVLIGRLTKDPDLRYTSSNVPTVNFTIAVSRPFANQAGVREADFINVVVWRKQAENVKKFVTKGSLVAVEGRIQTRNYDGQDGKKVYVTEVIADNVQFLDSKNQRSSNSDVEFNDAPTTDVADEPYIDFGDTIELSDDDIAF